MPRGLFFTLLLATAAPIATSVAAQTDTLTPRVAKIEKELRAVQRKVFPNGETILEPEIRPDTAEVPPPGTAASAPLADLTARVDSLEGQLAQITGQAEQNSYRLRQLEDQVKSLSAQADTRLKALEGGVAPAGTAPPPVRPTSPVDEPPQSDARAAQLAAVARPSTGDEADDRYIFGYRLWQAKLYPEAETELKAVVAKFPKDRRASYAQNLLGRAYMDEGKPALASVAFYDNYQKNPKGERASESLTWLGTALIRLKKPADACKVYEELEDVYGATLTATLRAQMLDGRKKAKCA